MKIRTQDLTGGALDWAVCMANGMKPEDIYINRMGKRTSLYRRLRDEDGNLDGRYVTGPDLLFSHKWEAGGPIIEREGIGFYDAGPKWWAHPRGENYTQEGPTPLIAAMRCYVASKLGDEIDIPPELIP